MILGLKWMEENRIGLEPWRRALTYPEDCPPRPAWQAQGIITLDDAGKLLHRPEYQEDADRRDRLMAEEDRRCAGERRSRRLTKAEIEKIYERIYELER